MDDNKTLTIDRAHWRTGGDNAETRARLGRTMLLNDKGMMCCLGFESIRCGIPKESILGHPEPSSIFDTGELAKIPHLATYTSYTEEGEDEVDVKHNEFTNTAMGINDNAELTDDERERQITDHFATIGVTVVFTGNYPQ